MANFFTNLFSSGASNLVDAVGDAIDKNVSNGEEMKELENELAKASMKFEIDMATLGVKAEELYLADTSSARAHQTAVQTSENASWLAKNVHPMLAVGILGLTFGMYFWILRDNSTIMANDNGMKEIVIYILGALTTVSTQVAAYYFGSSQGSKDKQKAMLGMNVSK